MKNKYKFLLFLIISSSINSDDLMKPTSFSKDLYKQDILEGNYNNDNSPR